MKYFRKLVGQKCYLSPIDPDDIETYTAWLNDLEVARYLSLAPNNISLPGEKAALERLVQGHTYGIVVLGKDTLIGSVGLNGIDHIDRRCGIGIFIGNKEYWGKGYGTEVLRLLLGYTFDYLNMHNVMLTTYAFNERAMGCYRKVGFKEFGRRREAIFRDGRYHDEIHMDILEDDFRRGGPPSDAAPNGSQDGEAT